MAELLFNCPKCSKSLAVDSSGAGLKFACTDCRERITVPEISVEFRCPECRAELCASEEMKSAFFECPECLEDILIPVVSPSDAAGDEGRTIRKRRPVNKRPVVTVTAGDDDGPPAEFQMHSSWLARIDASFARWAALGLVALVFVYLLAVIVPGLVRPEFVWNDEKQVLPLPWPDAPRPLDPSAGSDTPRGMISEEDPVAVAPPEAPAQPREPVGAGTEPVPDATGSVDTVETARALVPLGAVPVFRGQYEDALRRVENDYAELTGDWPALYTNALMRLQSELQEAGNLEGWMAVRDELARFGVSGGIPSTDIAEEPEKLRVLQHKHRELLADIQVKKSREVLGLTDSYMAMLKKVQSERTREGRIDEALEYNRELKRVSTCVTVTAARFTLTDHAARTDPPEPVAPDPDNSAADDADDGADSFKPELTHASPSSSKPRIYQDAAPPPLSGKTISELPLMSDTRTIVGRSVKLKAFIGMESWVDSTESARPDLTIRARKRSARYVLRLALRSTRTHPGLEQPLMAVQHFVRSVGDDSRAAIREVAVDFVALPYLQPEWVYVDFPPVEIRGSQITLAGDGFYRSSQGGDEFTGIVMTLFDDTGKKALQVMTDSSLRKLGLGKVPDEWNGWTPEKR